MLPRTKPSDALVLAGSGVCPASGDASTSGGLSPPPWPPRMIAVAIEPMRRTSSDASASVAVRCVVIPASSALRSGTCRERAALLRLFSTPLRGNPPPPPSIASRPPRGVSRTEIRVPVKRASASSACPEHLVVPVLRDVLVLPARSRRFRPVLECHVGEAQVLPERPGIHREQVELRR